MPRTTGAKNIKLFKERDSIGTTSSGDVKHLAGSTGSCPLSQFRHLLKHQKNFLAWVDSRHQQLLQAKRDAGERGPKDAVYRKYRWYLEQQLLLEAINAFEVFYKRSFIALAEPLRRYVPSGNIKGTVDAKTLWGAARRQSLVSLIFEHQLYHDLDQVDKAAQMLVGHKRYNPANLQSPMRPIVRALQCTFQLRHTLSHNQGLVTASDAAKLKALGYTARVGEIIDPTMDHLGTVIRDFLGSEAAQFTEWLLASAAKHLRAHTNERNELLPAKLRQRIEKSVGKHPEIDALDWDA